MSYYRDLDPCGLFGFFGADVLAVGWLDAAHAFSTGAVDEELLQRLVELAADPWEPRVTWGYQPCVFCPGALPRTGTEVVYGAQRLVVGARNLFIPASAVIYAAPSLIVHYIQAHRYEPPREFVAAVKSCPPMWSEEYALAMKHVAPAAFDDAMFRRE